MTSKTIGGEGGQKLPKKIRQHLYMSSEDYCENKAFALNEAKM